MARCGRPLITTTSTKRASRRCCRCAFGARERVLHVLERASGRQRLPDRDPRRPRFRRHPDQRRPDAGPGRLPTRTLRGLQGRRRGQLLQGPRARAGVRRPGPGGDARGTLAGGGVPNFFRRPFGPGWALVGDAGYTKDPLTAQGISDAFRDAELCAAAVDETFNGGRSFNDAMSAYQQTRDARAMPIYEFTTQLATLEPPPPEMQQLLAAVHGNQDAMDDFVSVTAGTVSPVEFFGPDNIGRLMSAALAI